MICSRLVRALGFSALLLTADPLAAGVDRWTPLGPDGGGVTALAVASGVSGLVYAGTAAAGVFTSRDGGSTWQPALTGLPSGDPILFLAAGGRDGRSLYAATQFAFYTSANGGQQWTRRQLPVELPIGLSSAGIVSLAASPVAPQTAYLSFSRESFTGGLLKSTDGGKHWQTLDTGVSQAFSPSFAAIAIAPSAPDTVYLATYSQGGRILRTTDGGGHWSVAGTLDSDAFYAFVKLAVDPRRPRTVYAAWNDKVARSTDGGATWSRLADVGTPPGEAIAGAADLAVDPASPGTLYFAFNRYVPGYGGWYDGGILKFDGRIVRSVDGGASWSQPAVTDAVAALKVDGVRTSHLYAGVSRIGILRSDDRGGQWRQSNLGLSAAPVCSVTPDPFTRDLLYVSAGLCDTPYDVLGSSDDLGFLKGTTAASWTKVNRGARDPERALEAYGIVADPSVPGTLYAATGQGLFKSVNGGARWDPLQDGLGAILDAVFRVAIDPTDTRRLYAVGYKLGYPICGGFCPLLPVYDAAQSTDGGITWTKLLPSTISFGFDAEGYTGFDLVIDPHDPRTLYVGHATAHLFKSTDRGATWSVVTVRIPGQADEGLASRLVIDPSAPRTLYAAVQFGNDSIETVVKSTDGGQTWARAALGLPQLAGVTDLVLDRALPSTLYAATTQGVFLSTDGAGRWSPLANGLSPRTVWQIRIDPFDPATIYAGTEGEGGLYVLTRSDR